MLAVGAGRVLLPDLARTRRPSDVKGAVPHPPRHRALAPLSGMPAAAPRGDWANLAWTSISRNAPDRRSVTNGPRRQVEGWRTGATADQGRRQHERREGRWTVAGSSGSTAAARSPTWSPAARTARWPSTSCSRRTPAATTIRPWPGSGTCCPSPPASPFPPNGSAWSASAPRSRRMPCWSARASPPSWSSRPASPTRCGSPTRNGQRSSRARSSGPRWCTRG